MDRKEHKAGKLIGCWRVSERGRGVQKVGEFHCRRRKPLARPNHHPQSHPFLYACFTRFNLSHQHMSPIALTAPVTTLVVGSLDRGDEYQAKIGACEASGETVEKYLVDRIVDGGQWGSLSLFSLRSLAGAAGGGTREQQAGRPTC